MDKRRAIQIMTKAAQLKKEHLEDQKVLFLYGLPKEVNKQLQESNKILSSVQGYEVVFHRYFFLHLTVVRLNNLETASAIHFYQKCLDKRLTENDFVFAKDGSTGQKLDILERMMLIKKNVTIFFVFLFSGPKLYCLRLLTTVLTRRESASIPVLQARILKSAAREKNCSSINFGGIARAS